MAMPGLAYFLILTGVLVVAARPATRAQAAVTGAPLTLTAQPPLLLPGLPVAVKGSTEVGKIPVTVALTVTDPDGKSTPLTLKTNAQGAFGTTLTQTRTVGWYTLRAVSADQKTVARDSFLVLVPGAYAAQTTAVLKETNAAAQQAVEQMAVALEELPASAATTQAKAKLSAAETQLRADEKLIKSTGDGLANVLKVMQQAPAGLSYLQPGLKSLAEQADEAKAQATAIRQQLSTSQKNTTICECINDVVEILGTLSLIKNFEEGVVKTTFNIVTDKVLPGFVERGSWTGDPAKLEIAKGTINEAQKTFSTTLIQGWGASRKFFKDGFVLDVKTLVGKVLYAQYCTELKGPANLTFTSDFLHKSETYWHYQVTTQGTLTLRYGKEKTGGGAIAVSGEFEGYRVGFKGSEDFTIVEPVPPGMALLRRELLAPPAINAGAISADLGLAGRTLVPGAYRVKVAGTVVGDKLTLKVVESPYDGLDTGPKAQNFALWVVLLQPMLPIPVIRRFELPVAPSRVMFVVGLGGSTSEFTLSRAQNKLTLKQDVSHNRQLDGILLKGKLSLNLTN